MGSLVQQDENHGLPVRPDRSQPGLAGLAARGRPQAPRGALRPDLPVLDDRGGRRAGAGRPRGPARDPSRDPRRRRAEVPDLRAPAELPLSAASHLSDRHDRDGAARARPEIEDPPCAPARVHQQRVPRPPRRGLRVPPRAHRRDPQPCADREVPRARGAPRARAHSPGAGPHRGSQGGRGRRGGGAAAARARPRGEAPRRRRAGPVVGLHEAARGPAARELRVHPADPARGDPRRARPHGCAAAGQQVRALRPHRRRGARRGSPRGGHERGRRRRERRPLRGRGRDLPATSRR